MTPDELRYKLRKAKGSEDQDNSCAAVCIDYLVERGYRVHFPIVFDLDSSITKYGDLIALFYNLYSSLYVDELPRTENKAADIKIARQFLKSRMENHSSKVSRKQALSECAAIIKTVVLNKDVFKFHKPLGFWVFGTASCRWVIDKALAMLDKERKLRFEEEAEASILQICTDMSDEERFGNLDKQLALVRGREGV